MAAQSFSEGLFVTQDEGLSHGSEHHIASNDEGIRSTQAASKSKEKKPGSEKKSDFEKKAGVKRKAPEDVDNENDTNGETELESKWGPNIRAPRSKVNPKVKIIGKMAGSYKMCEIRRILQHFNRLDRVPPDPVKDDLLHLLVDLSSDEDITAKDRCWILRQPLGPGGLRHQTLNADGTPAPDSYPAGRAPRNRAAANSMAPSSKIPKGPPRKRASKAMPPPPRFCSYTSVSAPIPKADGKKSMAEATMTPQPVPAEELLKMILSCISPLIPSQIQSRSRFVLDYDKIADLVSEKMHDNAGVKFSSSSGFEAIVGETMKRLNLKSQKVDSGIDSTISPPPDSPGSPLITPQASTMPNLFEIDNDDEDGDEDPE